MSGRILFSCDGNYLSFKNLENGLWLEEFAYNHPVGRFLNPPIWTSVKDYLIEIISAAAAAWTEVKRQLWLKVGVPAGGWPTEATRLTSPPDSPEPQEPPAQAQATQVSAECQPESERERGSERRKNKKSTLSERLDLCPERLSWVCFWIYLQETVHCPMHVNFSVQRPKHLSLMPMWSSLLYIAPAMSDCRPLFVKFLILKRGRLSDFAGEEMLNWCWIDFSP